MTQVADLLTRTYHEAQRRRPYFVRHWIEKGESRLVDLDVEKDTFFLAAFAEFADYQTQKYSDVVPISDGV